MPERSSLFLALAEVELHFPGSRSLKEKRQDLRSLLDRVRHRFAVLAIECDFQELHQRAGLAITALATGPEPARATVGQVLNVIHETFPGVVLAEKVSIHQLR